MAIERMVKLLGLTLAVAFVGLIITPRLHLFWMLGQEGKSYSALLKLRGAIREYQLSNGRNPPDLNALGMELPLPIIVARDADGSRHKHKRVQGVEVRPGLGAEGFDVNFFIDLGRGPQAKSVSIEVDLNGNDAERWELERVFASGIQRWHGRGHLRPGLTRFRFVVDGRQREWIETRLHLGPGGHHANARPTLPEFEDLGKWLYDPETGMVALACTGRTIKLNHRLDGL